MRISPLILTLILAIITGVLAISAWGLLAGHFNPPGTPAGVQNNSTRLNPVLLQDLVEGIHHDPQLLPAHVKGT